MNNHIKHKTTGSRMLYHILHGLFAILPVAAVAQTEVVNITLNQPTTGTHDYLAKEYVDLTQGFTYTASGSDFFHGKVDPNLLVFPYPDDLTGGSDNGLVGGPGGQFAVSPTGASTYNIPISLPPGTGGMVPQISITYSSGNGNGLMGVGFSLSGLSAVTRCAANYYNDGWISPFELSVNDRFMLDGQRLIVKNGQDYGSSGSEYRTENNIFSKITAIGTAGTGPEKFLVKTKSGLTYYYGYTSDSRIEGDTSGSVAFWLVNRIEDTKGNYISITYYEDDLASNIQYRPIKIEYTGNETSSPVLTPYNSIEFVYEERHDTLLSYKAGTKSEITHRLTKIECKYQGQLIREYVIGYRNFGGSNASHVETITEQGPTGKKYNPIRFDWQEERYNIYNRYTYNSNTNFRYSNLYYTADYNGDGKTDLVTLENHDGGNYENLALYTYESGSFVEKYRMALPSSCNGASVGDYNGDGLADLIISCHSDRSYYYVWLARKSSWGFDQHSFTFNHTSVKDIKVGDFDGDGLSEFLIRFDGTNTTKIYGGSYDASDNYSFGDKYPGFSLNNWANEVNVADFNGDGRSDLYMFKSGGLEIMISLFTLSSACFLKIHTQSYPRSSNIYQLGDFNGDGRSDILVYGHEGDESVSYWDTWNIYHANEDGFTKYSYQAPFHLNEWFNQHRLYLSDFNGDGRTDFFIGATDYGHPYPAFGCDPANGNCINPSSFFIAASDGKKFYEKNLAYDDPEVPLTQEPTTWEKLIKHYNQRYILGNFLGSGNTELLLVCPYEPHDGQGYNGYYFAYAERSVGNDQVKKITNSIGHETLLTYAPLTDNTVYQSQADAVYPLIDLDASIFVVKSYKQSNGKGGYFEYQYTYEGAKVHRLGKGYLGFMKTTTKDIQNDLKVINTYEYNSQYVTMALKSSETLLSSLSRTISRTDNTNTIKSFGSTFSKSYNFGDTVSVTKTYEPATGSLYLTTTSAYTYDDYGNLTQNSIDKNGKFSIASTNVFTNDETNWILGRLTNATVVKSATGKPNLTRTSQFEYYADGLLKKEISEPDYPEYRIEKEYIYDGFGNITESRTTADGETRYLYTAFDEKGRFTTETANELGHEETYTFDPLYGNKLTQTGPNLLTTTYKYDAMGQPKKTIAPDGNQSFSGVGWCKGGGNEPSHATPIYYSYSETNGSAPVIEYYDILGRVIRQVATGYNGTKIYVDKYYDNKGRMEKESLPYYANASPAGFKEYDYDLAGRVDIITLPDGHTVDYEYNGFTTKVTNPKGQKRIKVMDEQGLMVSSKGDGLSDELTYDYDAAGNLLEVKFDNATLGFTITSKYDLIGNQIKLTDPDLGIIEYDYNAFGELIYQKDSRGDTTTMDYDVLGRVKQRIETEGTTTWTYDTKKIGQLSKVTMTNGDYEEYFYDGLGRVIKQVQKTGGETFAVENTYDDYGRLQKLDYPSDFAVEYNYNTHGYLEKVQKAGGSDVYWQAEIMNARGQMESFTTGNNKLRTERWYNSKNGYLEHEKVEHIQNGWLFFEYSYHYDEIGNLTRREDARRNYIEDFEYDDFNRLTDVYLDESSTPTTRVYYDILGNITAKTDVGVYTYNTTNKHAVKSISGSPGLLSTDSQNILYTSFDKVSEISGGTARMTYKYGTGRQRVKTQTYISGTLTATKYYAGGGIYEKEIDETTGQYKQVHYISAGGELIAIYTKESTGTSETSYLMKDHLGSIVGYVNENGTNPVYLSFDAWGNRRNPENWAQLYPTGSIPNLHGFTGHEHMDLFRLINMNGRVFDPTVGRFLSADPFVQMPDNLQGLNRYSYCLNNPLSLTDPSGYKYVDLGAYARTLINVTVAIAFSASTAGMGLFAVMASGAGGGFVGGFLGASLSGTANDLEALKAGAIGGLFGALSSSIAYGIGEGGKYMQEVMGGEFGMKEKLAYEMVMHGTTQGGIEELQGGKFIHGFVSGALSSASGSLTAGWQSDGARIIVGAVVGGTASAIGGGKFANGAITGAYVTMFNSCMHGDGNPPKGTHEYQQWTELTEAEKTILKNNPKIVFQLRNNRTEAEKMTALLFPTARGWNDYADAFRHAYFSALNTKSFGYLLSKQLGDAHEAFLGNDVLEMGMDLHNNRIGRSYGQSMPLSSNETISNFIYNATINGELRMIINDRLIPTRIP